MEGELVIRAMTKDDVARVHELETVCFITPWSYNSLLGELKNKLAHYAVSELDGSIIGYCGMWVYFGEAHITNIATAPENRRCGYGKKLLLYMMRLAVEHSARSMSLEVREHNFAAQNMYYALGFEKAGIRKRYYSDTGENALILWNNDIEKTLREQGILQ